MGTSRVISGPKEGAGELGGNYAGGKMMNLRKGADDSQNPNGKTPKGNPKGMKTYKEGDPA